MLKLLDTQEYNLQEKKRRTRFKVFYIQNKEMSHSWFYHFNTRMPKICLFLIGFWSGGLFLPLSKKFLTMSMILN